MIREEELRRIGNPETPDDVYQHVLAKYGDEELAKQVKIELMIGRKLAAAMQDAKTK